MHVGVHLLLYVTSVFFIYSNNENDYQAQIYVTFIHFFSKGIKCYRKCLGYERIVNAFYYYITNQQMWMQYAIMSFHEFISLWKTRTEILMTLMRINVH